MRIAYDFGETPVPMTPTAALAQEEAQILQAMGRATLGEQRQLVARLDRVRSQRLAAVQASRDVDLASTDLADLAPGFGFVRHGSGTDFLGDGDLFAPDVGQGDPAINVSTEASLWYERVSPAVKADQAEFATQALGMARAVAGKYGGRAEQMAKVFLTYVARLHRQAGDADVGADLLTTTFDNSSTVVPPDVWPLDPNTMVNDLGSGPDDADTRTEASRHLAIEDLENNPEPLPEPNLPPISDGGGGGGGGAASAAGPLLDMALEAGAAASLHTACAACGAVLEPVEEIRKSGAKSTTWAEQNGRGDRTDALCRLSQDGKHVPKRAYLTNKEPKFRVGDQVMDFRGRGPLTVTRVRKVDVPGKSYRVEVNNDGMEYYEEGFHHASRRTVADVNGVSEEDAARAHDQSGEGQSTIPGEYDTDATQPPFLSSDWPESDETGPVGYHPPMSGAGGETAEGNLRTAVQYLPPPTDLRAHMIAEHDMDPNFKGSWELEHRRDHGSSYQTHVHEHGVSGEWNTPVDTMNDPMQQTARLMPVSGTDEGMVNLYLSQLFNPSAPARKVAAKGPQVPFQLIRHHMGNVHVSTPDHDVEAQIRGATRGAGWTEAKVKQAVNYALKVHHENQNQFTNVMGKQVTGGNPHPLGSPAWFEWEGNPKDEGRGPHSGVPQDIFPEGGVPLHGDLTPEQDAWLRRDRGLPQVPVSQTERAASLLTAAEDDLDHDDPPEDPEWQQAGYGRSELPQVEVTDPQAQEPNFPWLMQPLPGGGVGPAGTLGNDAANVANVPTPGAANGYPQPKAAAFRARIQRSLAAVDTTGWAVYRTGPASVIHQDTSSNGQKNYLLKCKGKGCSDLATHSQNFQHLRQLAEEHVDHVHPNWNRLGF